MLKKCFFASSILALTAIANVATASTGPAPYIGGSMGITANTATSNAFGSYRGVPFQCLPWFWRSWFIRTFFLLLK